MSVSSVSSYSDILLEEYLEKQKKLQQQKQQEAAKNESLSNVNTTLNRTSQISLIG
jgi:cell division protein FtsB